MVKVDPCKLYELRSYEKKETERLNLPRHTESSEVGGRTMMSLVW